jgi:hypothetical protein
VDDARVLALMGLNAKAQRDKALASKRQNIYALFDQTAMFPISANPTWNLLKQMIANNPALLLKEWRFSTRFYSLPHEMSWLFIDFMRYLWLMVVEGAFKGVVPSPTSLEDAMRCWTVESIDEALFNTTFEACNVGLESADGTVHGHQGPMSMSFSD